MAILSGQDRGHQVVTCSCISAALAFRDHSTFYKHGYDRELHGALLDSKILGDVYLSMTGGQSDLDFSTTDENEHNRSLSQDQTSSGKKLKVIKVTAKEKARNLEYLSKMKEETEVEPIWNLEHE